MIELKVQCDCGQRYKFDVEPVNGQMPFSVHCPICGAEGTEKANALLRQNETLLAVAAAPATGPGALRVNRSAYATPVSAPPPITPVASPAAPPAQRPFPGLAQRVATPKTPGKPPNFWMGIVGGLVGALSGAVIYFLIFSYTGFTFRLFAIPVGFFAGLGAHLLGRGEGSKELGGITAILAMAGIVAAQYFVALGWWNKALSHAGAGSGYTVMVATAKEAVKAIPTGSDSEIRNYLAGDEGVAPTAVSDDDVKNFRERNLPEFQDLASGKMTEQQFDTKHGIDPVKEHKVMQAEDDTFKSLFCLLLFSRTGIFSLVAAAGLAYKMSSNA